MNILSFPISQPCWFWSIALVTSLYYGSRGPLIQRFFRKEQGWTEFEMWWIHYIQDFMFNFICAIAGFASLDCEARILSSIADFAKVETGSGILIVFLGLLAVTGISGQLPSLLAEGKFPKSR